MMSQILSRVTPVAVSRSNVSSKACSGSLKPEILISGRFAFDRSSFIECSRSFKRAGVCKLGYSRRNSSGLRYLSIVTERCYPEDWLDPYSRDAARCTPRLYLLLQVQECSIHLIDACLILKLSRIT